MADLVVLETCPDFASASRQAKELAVLFQEWVSIERVPTGWAVLVPRVVWDMWASRAVEEAEDIDDVGCDDFYDDEYSPYDEEYQNGLIEEGLSYQDLWAFSEETGWFYVD